jgi:hypothetical protein
MTISNPGLPPHHTLADNQAFYQSFESLGANCEFGLVQRRHGAEPLGLLRWPAITVQGLVASLNDAFSELQDIANLRLIPGPKDEWDIAAPNFSLHLHERIGSVDEKALLKSAHRRLQFLRRSLLETLEDAEKILVFKEWQFRMTDADIASIFESLKRYNAGNRLVAVRLAAPDGPVGSVTEVEPGLWSGYVESDAQVSAAENVPFDSWDRICRQVWRGGL